MSKAAEIIRNCLAEKKMSQRQLSGSMGEDVRHLNQQLKRQKDMKVERFIDVLDSIGYRMEVVENGGIRKVCKEYADAVIETGKPAGLFWTFSDGKYTAIDSTGMELFCESFESKAECIKWFRCGYYKATSGFEHFD